MKKTYWIASYPKSGNTWLRIFLNNLLHDDNEPVCINDLPVHNIIASARLPFDLALGLKSSDLLPDEIACLRPRVDEILAQESPKKLFRKIHDAYLHTACGDPIISTRASAGVIYLIRNPLDVTVSYAHHYAISFDKGIQQLGDRDNQLAFRPNGTGSQFSQMISCWSRHVRSWTEQTDIPVLVLRYEDLLADPLTYFARAVHFAGLGADIEDIQAAIEASRFDKLQSQEQRERFKETPRGTTHFFRKGQAGDWRNHLSKAQIQAIVTKHGQVMGAHGYL